MTHVQQLFINNIRYYRTKAGYSQLVFSEKVGLSPNYLNAVENGKNFPSLEALQKMIDVLGLLPYQLFLERPNAQDISTEAAQVVTRLKQQVIGCFDTMLENCTDCHTPCFSVK